MMVTDTSNVSITCGKVCMVFAGLIFYCSATHFWQQLVKIFKDLNSY